VIGGPIQRVVTHGVFELDGGSWEVDNNIWLVGDDSEVVVFDAAHDAAPNVMAVGGRNVVAVVCTHGHNDHGRWHPNSVRRWTPQCCCIRLTRCCGE
jgi:Metallo-beta-lactamase superfamily